MSEPDVFRAIALSYRSMMAAIITYAITLGLGIGGAVLAAYGHKLPAVILGSVAFVTACLCIAAFRAAHKWRSYADSLDEVR